MTTLNTKAVSEPASRSLTYSDFEDWANVDTNHQPLLSKPGTNMMKSVFIATWLVLLSLVRADIRAADTEQPKAPPASISLKTGVVRISSTIDNEHRTGTGFILKIDNENTYVVTAAHVVEGDRSPMVEFFTRQGSLTPARIVGIEGGESRGLALLVVLTDKELRAGLTVLVLGTARSLRSGDEMEAIGFPAGAGKWAVTKGSYSGTEGRDLLFAGIAGEGSSGGPLIREGKVVGIITSVTSEFARASSADTVREFVRGWHISLNLGLRSAPATISRKEISGTLARLGFFEAHLNPTSPGTVAALQMVASEGDAIAFDLVTGLMWNSNLSSFEMRFAAAKVYVQQLNDKALGGYRDWRLPTAEELASRLGLKGLEPHRLRYIWTVDTDPNGGHWLVDGVDAEITRIRDPSGYVWAVRGPGDTSGP